LTSLELRAKPSHLTLALLTLVVLGVLAWRQMPLAYQLSFGTGPIALTSVAQACAGAGPAQCGVSVSPWDEACDPAILVNPPCTATQTVFAGAAKRPVLKVAVSFGDVANRPGLVFDVPPAVTVPAGVAFGIDRFQGVARFITCSPTSCRAVVPSSPELSNALRTSTSFWARYISDQRQPMTLPIGVEGLPDRD
jgi:invasion protein IalB